jgi:RNA polymerase sigma factor (sigma-70 family)
VGVHENLDDAELLRRARAEPEAFGVFYRRHVDWVLAYLARRVDDREAVADLAAESFAAALLGASRFDRHRGPASAWLFGIVHHQMSAYRRRGAVEARAQRRLAMERVVLDEQDVALLDQLAVEPVASGLLAELPPDQRDAVRGHVLRGRSYRQLSAETGVAEATLRQRVSRGLAGLRARLGGDVRD